MNYQKELEHILENNQKIPKLLLHSCCGPCSTYVLEYLNQYFDITIYYYNPNMDTLTEFKKRLNEQIKVINNMPSNRPIKLIEGNYEIETYLKYIKGLEHELEGGNRCHKCYYLRLQETAKLAKKLGFDYFGTTLTVSPYKNAKVINEIGATLEKEYQISYLYSDFKKKNGYKRSIELSKQYDLYRQNYCGCIFSKRGEENEKK